MCFNSLAKGFFKNFIKAQKKNSSEKQLAMENNENEEDYTKFLDSPEFIKWGIVISCLVWKKSYSEVRNALGVTKTYISKVKQVP